jgi:hypothetical protein
MLVQLSRLLLSLVLMYARQYPQAAKCLRRGLPIKFYNARQEPTLALPGPLANFVLQEAHAIHQTTMLSLNAQLDLPQLLALLPVHSLMLVMATTVLRVLRYPYVKMVTSLPQVLTARSVQQVKHANQARKWTVQTVNGHLFA